MEFRRQNPQPQFARHSGSGTNVIFGDGHAKFRNQGSMAWDPNRASQGLAYDFCFKLPIRPDDDRLR